MFDNRDTDDDFSTQQIKIVLTSIGNVTIGASIKFIN